MAEPATRPIAIAPRVPPAAVKDGLDLAARESQELILGFSGAIGCGMEFVTAAVKRVLENQGYEIVHLKLSHFIELLLKKNLVEGWESNFNDRNRYEKLQLAGNLLRSKRTTDFLAEISIAAISLFRVKKDKGNEPENQSIEAIVPGRVAYLIDQLKHPDEVALLRKVYGNLFYLIGALTGEKQRAKNLAESLSPGEITSVMERDQRDEVEHGQQLDRTLKLSDFFIRNNYQNNETIEKAITRFLSLLHGQTSRTPLKAEYAMYAAFSAGLRSACLSRQVGAAITDAEGNVIATGCNDVPKANGGLYSEEDSPDDHRCINLHGGRCFNDHHKDLLGSEIESLLVKEHAIAPQVASKVASAIRSKTGLRDLIEFSRAVHAEMDALVSIARRGGVSVAGGSLYSTTFPCHNCARHIVAAGISKVYYIEPYEKSLALDLHSDAINSDSDDGVENKVQFLHFEGVAPRQYQDLFLAKSERKKDGVAIRQRPVDARKSRVQYLDSYRSLESKVVENLKDQGLSDAEIVELSAPTP